MKYREFGKTGCSVSVLGFGAMRMPVIEKDDKKEIDEKQAIAMIRRSIDSGVNYVDTAYFYHDGESEILVGKALKDGYREKTYLATKLPMGEVKETADFDRLLNRQLEKLCTDHIDFYLFHALDRDSWEKVVSLGLVEKMHQAKADGRIRHMGFSFHDDPEVFIKIIDGFEGCEFCQIQYNYLDRDYQAGDSGLEYAAKKGLGVVIMEPLRGGRLVNIPDIVAEKLPQNYSLVEMALGFVWSRKGVSLLLSGMSTPEQVEENIKLADTISDISFSPEEEQALWEAKRASDALTVVNCTQCRYCQPCPHGVEIPDIFAAYNNIVSGGRAKVKEIMPDIEYRVAKCKKCGECEKKCPQHLKIIKELHDVADKF